MYKIASDKRQTTLHRGQLRNWVGSGSGEQEPLTGEALYAQLRQETIILQDRIAASTDLHERKALGLQRYEAQTKISELRKAGFGGKRPEIATVFMNLSRTMLPKQQYEMILKEANRQLEEGDRKIAEARKRLNVA